MPSHKKFLSGGLEKCSVKRESPKVLCLQVKDGSYHNAKIYKTKIEKWHDRTKICLKQECIPVGCVPSAAVAVCPGGSTRGGLPGGVLPDTPPCDRMTDRCKNITLPQLRCER